MSGVATTSWRSTDPYRSPVVLDQPCREVPFQLPGNCTASGREYASRDIVHPSQGFSGILIFDTNTVDHWDVHDWSEAPGRYAVPPSSGWDTNSGDLMQNTAYVTVELGSRLTATTARANGLLTFDAHARSYSPNVSDWNEARRRHCRCRSHPTTAPVV